MKRLDVKHNDGRFSLVADALASCDVVTHSPILGGFAAIWAWVAQEPYLLVAPLAERAA
jgi:hypothetical protein